MPDSDPPPSAMRSRPLHAAAPEWTIADLLTVLYRRRGWIAASVSSCFLLAFLYWICTPPRYLATAQIEVHSQSQGAFGLQNSTADKPSTDVEDSFAANLSLQTQMGILQSDALALDVIRRTALEATPDYFPPASAHAFLRSLFFWRKPVEPLSTPLAEAPSRRYAALQTFARFRKVSTMSGTRLITVAYSDRDAARAAQVANALVDSLADYTFQSRSAAAAQSASWLTAQLADLKNQTDALDRRAASLDREAGALGDEDSHNVVLARLDELNAALSTAESNRILREAIWRSVQSGDPEAISALGGNPNAGASTQNSFALLQSLRAQESAATAQLAESSSRYGENWPAVAEQRARLATIRKSIQDEVRRLGERAHSDYQVSLQAENSARAAFAQQKQLAENLTGTAVALRLARQQAGESRTLYTTLASRLQQAGVLQGLHSASFTVVTPALVPPPDHPASPSLRILFSLALGAGIALGSTAAIVRELTDDRIYSAAEVETFLDLPVMAALPRLPAQAWYRRILPAAVAPPLTLQAADSPGGALPPDASPAMEALRSLRASLLLSRSEIAPQVILMTPADEENSSAQLSHRAHREPPPSTPARDLAAVLAQHGSPTIYVNANLRAAPAPGQAACDPGLSEWLAGADPPALSSPPNLPPLLSILPSGARSPSPSELIASRRMSALLSRWRGEYFHIVIDGPPLKFSDSLVLAQQADAVLVSIAAGRSTRSAVLPALHSLSRQLPERAVLGVVLEGVSDAHA